MPNILYKAYENLDKLKKIFEESVILCEYCKDDFEPNTILVHISRSKVCKSHYGSKYDEIKQIMRSEKMKKTSKEAYHKIKQKKDLQKKKERKEFQEKEAKSQIDFHEREARNKNSIWRKKIELGT